MDLYIKTNRYQSSAQCQPFGLTMCGLHQTERTRLCRWMVYSRATTSWMAERPPAFLLVLVVEDIATGVLS